MIGGFFFLTAQIEQPETGFATPLILVNRLDDNDLEEDPRIPVWRGSLRASADSYFLGMGIGQFKGRFSEYFQGENNISVYEVVSFGYHLTPHSDYFAILTTYGIIGLVLYLLFLFYSSQKKWLHIKFSATTKERTIHQIAFTFLIALMLFGVTADNFNSALYWFLLSMATKTPN